MLRLCLIAAMGGLLFGYDYIVVAGAKPFYEPFFGLVGDAWKSGFAMSSAVFGCIIGAVAFMRLPDKWGRKTALLLSAFFFTASAVWTAFASTFASFILARVLGGLGIGIASNASPVYIAEVSPPEKRGALVSLNQLTIVIGFIIAQAANLVIYNSAPVAAGATADVIRESWNGQIGWRLMFGAETIPALAFFILTWTIPESPMWLESRRQVGELQSAEAKSDWMALFDKKVMGIVALGVFLAVFQQWCGINVVFNYAEDVLKAAGYDVSGVMFNQVIIGTVNCLSTIFAILLVDRWGRRPLMLTGAGGLAVLYTILGLCYHYHVTGVGVLLVVLGAVSCFAITLGPITWVLLSEIFPTRVRGTAMSIAVAALWVGCYTLTLSFPPINKAVGADGSFWLYAAVCAVGCVVIHFFVRETKGQTLR